MRGWWLLTLFFVIFGIVIILTINSYQKFERGTPVRKRVFTYRISKLVESLGDYIEDVREDKHSVTIRMFHYKNPLIIRYHKDLLINAGGILVGTPVSIPKKAHPKTYFISIEGKSGRFNNVEVYYDFSARVNDEDPINGFGVRIYKHKKRFIAGDEHVQIESNNHEILSFKNQLSEAIKGTILKGELEFENGRFVLRIYDNIYKMSYTRGKLKYQKYKGYNKLETNGVAEPKMAFYGIKNIIEMIL